MRKSILAFTIVLPALLWAFDEARLKPITLIGTVVDTGCYMVHDGIGPDHAKCATECAKKGVGLAILDANDKVYVPIGMNHSNPNKPLMPYIEQKVKVTGTLVERGGLSGIAIKTVEPAK